MRHRSQFEGALVQVIIPYHVVTVDFQVFRSNKELMFRAIVVRFSSWAPEKYNLALFSTIVEVYYQTKAR